MNQIFQQGFTILNIAARCSLLRVVALCALAASALCATFIQVAAASTFGNGGVAIPPIYIPGGDNAPSAVVRQSDGKIVVAGNADGPIGRTMFAARFSVAGVLDQSYGTAGIAFVQLPYGAQSLEVNAATIDSSGNLVLAGQIELPLPQNGESSTTNTVVARLTPTGELDSAFGSGGFREIFFPGLLDNYATCVALDSAGRIVIAGYAAGFSGTGGFALARLTPAGTLDSTFNGTGRRVINLSSYTDAVQAVATGSNDGIVVLGYDGSIPGSSSVLVRLTATGQLDPSFNGTGVVRLQVGNFGSPLPMAIDSGDRVIVAGQPYEGATTVGAIRVTSTGVADASFGINGWARYELPADVFETYVSAVTRDSTDRIVLSFADTNLGGTKVTGIIRFSPDGEIDQTLNGTGFQSVPVNSFQNAGDKLPLTIDPSDNIVVAGSSYSLTPTVTFKTFVSRITASGALDATFNGTGLTEQICGVKQLTATALARQSDGKLVIGGYTGATLYDERVDFLVARLTASGVLDTTFNGSGFRAIDVTPNGADGANALVLDSRGNIVLAGQDGSYNFAVVRVRPDGVLDTAFNGSGIKVIGGPAQGKGGARGVALDSQGNILVAGRSAISGTDALEIIRLTDAGAIDPTFATGGVAIVTIGNSTVDSSQPNGIAIDHTGRILVGGWVNDGSSPVPAFSLVRLTNAGALDLSFAGAGIKNVGVGYSENGFAIDANDGAVLVGSIGPNSPGLGIVRLTVSGAVDPNFSGDNYFSQGESRGELTAVSIDGAGGVLLVGDIHVGRDVGTFALKLTSTGDVDAQFNAGQLAETTVNGAVVNHASAVVVDELGEVYIGGTVGRSLVIVKMFDGAPTNLDILAINGGAKLYAQRGFDVLVQAQDDNGNPQPVASDTNVTLSLKAGTANLSGSQGCTIPAGQTFCRVNNVLYSLPDLGVVLTASVTAGLALSPGESGPFAVEKWNSAVTLQTSNNPSQRGQSVTLTATVAGTNPSGVVIFQEGNIRMFDCFSDAPLVGTGDIKTATCTTTGLPVGTHNLRAFYAGDAINDVSLSDPLTQVVVFNQINVALSSNGGVASASSSYVTGGYPVAAVNNNERTGANWGSGGGWNDNTANTFPDWVQIDFNGSKTIDHVVVYTVQDNYTKPVEPSDTLTFTQWGVTSFTVQGWNGSQWQTLGTVTGNNLVKRTAAFPSYTTSRIRINVTGALASYSRITEVEAWGTTAIGLPPTTTTLASSVNPSTMGANVILTATVVGTAPTGSVNFTDGSTAIGGCSALTLTGSGNSKTAQCATAALTAGTHSIVANYSGDSANAASASTPLSQVVNAAGSVNVALASNGGVASASSTISPAFPVSSINNGERAGVNWGNGGGWNDGTGNTWPDWVQIAFNGSKTVDRVVFYTVQDNYANPVEPSDTQTFSLYGVTSFTVQGKQGRKWVTLATVTGNNLVKRTVTFAPFTTDHIRINVTKALASYSRITEVEAWGN